MILISKIEFIIINWYKLFIYTIIHCKWYCFNDTLYSLTIHPHINTPPSPPRWAGCDTMECHRGYIPEYLFGYSIDDARCKCQCDRSWYGLLCNKRSIRLATIVDVRSPLVMVCNAISILVYQLMAILYIKMAKFIIYI